MANKNTTIAFGSVRFGSVRFGSVRLGSARKEHSAVFFSVSSLIS